MKITEHKNVEVEEILGYTCDKCHKDFTDIYETSEFLHLYFTGGYSSVFGDGDTYEADLCQHCTKDVLGVYLRKTGEMF